MKITTTKTNSDLKKSSYIKVNKIGYYASFFAFPTLVFIIGINLWLSNKSEEAREWVNHTHQVKTSLYQVLLALQAAETGQRGYLLTENKNYLEPYTHSIVRIDEILTALQMLTLDNFKQQNSLKKVNPLIDEKLSELEETIFLITTQNREAALGIVMSGKGRRLMEQISQIITAMINEESALLIDRHHALYTNKKLTIWTQSLGSILLILIWVLTFYYIRKLLFQQAKSDEAVVLANEELVFQNQEKDKRTAQLTLAASVFTHALEGIVITDAANRVIDVNKKFTGITGYSREEVVGQAQSSFKQTVIQLSFIARCGKILNLLASGQVKYSVIAKMVKNMLLVSLSVL